MRLLHTSILSHGTKQQSADVWLPLILFISQHPPEKGKKGRKRAKKNRFRPISRKGGQTHLKPPFVTPPFAAYQIKPVCEPPFRFPQEGTVPNTVESTLQFLVLSGEADRVGGLHGPLPPALRKASHLRFMAIANQRMEGNIPSFTSTLSLLALLGVLSHHLKCEMKSPHLVDFS